MFEDINFSQIEITHLLDRLGIRNKTRNSDAIQIVCFEHDDKDFGNAEISSSKQAYHCLKCGASGSILSMVMHRMRLTFPEALEFTGKNNSQQYINFAYKKKDDIFIEEEKPEIKREKYSMPSGIKFNPRVYDYTRDRGFSKEFIEKFNIILCTQGYYKDYIIIPIISHEHEVETFEARDIIRDGLRDKVLYPKGCNLNKTIFNYNNLNKDEDLYIVEGIGSVSKIWTNISKNVTCTFGSQVTDSQIDILNEFSAKKILVPDNDEAGSKMIMNLSYLVENLYVKIISSEDIEDMYVDDILHTNPIEGMRYIIRTSEVLL